jgi:hypothetical protein
MLDRRQPAFETPSVGNLGTAAVRFCMTGGRLPALSNPSATTRESPYRRDGRGVEVTDRRHERAVCRLTCRHG